jgi:L-lactate dehydrogenase (cytochrome)
MPSQLSDVSRVDMRTTILGQPSASPLLLSPTGATKLFHADGERIVARVANELGLLCSLSTLSTTSIEDVAAASDGPKLFQLYMFDDRGFSEELIQRAKDSGYVALALTVDTPVAGNRERDFIYGFSAPPRSRLRQIASFLRHPRWLKRALIDKDLVPVNLTGSARMQEVLKTDMRSYIEAHLERSLTWRDVEWIRARWDGPLVIKGVQSVVDCQKALDAGATAVMVSNHGGRQLDSAPAPIDCIAEIADAHGDALEIICDGGIRRGTHVVKALAAGASAVGIGRAYLYGLAAGGEPGLKRCLTQLHAEIERTMALIGRPSIGEIDAGCLRHCRPKLRKL